MIEENVEKLEARVIRPDAIAVHPQIGVIAIRGQAIIEDLSQITDPHTGEILAPGEGRYRIGTDGLPELRVQYNDWGSAHRVWEKVDGSGQWSEWITMI